MSALTNKSEILASSAHLLHDNYMFPAVAHCSYYACYQLMKHIWLYVMNKSDEELGSNISQDKFLGSHEYLTNEVCKYIRERNRKDSKVDFQTLNSYLIQLKKLRVDADYSDTEFNFEKSQKAITLAEQILPILKRY